MITERLSFRAKYGRGDELVQLLKATFGKFVSPEVAGGRLYTDATGPMFSVIAESDFADMAAYAKFQASAGEMFANPEFQAQFAKMTECTESGERQLFNSEPLH